MKQMFNAGSCGLLLIVAIAGCQATPEAVGISDIPVFPGSRLIDREEFGALMGDVGSRLESFTTTIWHFTTTATATELMDYYKSRLPQAELEEMDLEEYAGDDAEDEVSEDDETFREEDMTRYTFYGTVGNPRSDEEFTVEIGDGWFAIAETLKD